MKILYINDVRHLPTINLSINILGKGLSNYVGASSEIVPLLKQCLDKALTVVPNDVISTTPVFMKATAGMRKLR